MSTLMRIKHHGLNDDVFITDEYNIEWNRHNGNGFGGGSGSGRGLVDDSGNTSTLNGGHGDGYGK